MLIGGRPQADAKAWILRSLWIRLHGYHFKQARSVGSQYQSCDVSWYGFSSLYVSVSNKPHPTSSDNSTLEDLLPGVIDSTIQLVLDTQGPGRPTPNNANSASVARDRAVLADLPGQFQLVMDEFSGFVYGESK